MPELKTGDRVKVSDQDIWGEITWIDSTLSKYALVLDDDRAVFFERGEGQAGGKDRLHPICEEIRHCRAVSTGIT